MVTSWQLDTRYAYLCFTSSMSNLAMPRRCWFKPYKSPTPMCFASSPANCQRPPRVVLQPRHGRHDAERQPQQEQDQQHNKKHNHKNNNTNNKGPKATKPALTTTRRSIMTMRMMRTTATATATPTATPTAATSTYSEVGASRIFSQALLWRIFIVFKLWNSHQHDNTWISIPCPIE